jgi:mRNA-degrading endonuclease RelE of RelBE toxin-antitoxin system
VTRKCHEHKYLSWDRLARRHSHGHARKFAIKIAHIRCIYAIIDEKDRVVTEVTWRHFDLKYGNRSSTNHNRQIGNEEQSS